MVVLKAAPALTAAIINVPFAAVAGKEIKVPGSPEEPEVIFPATDVIVPATDRLPAVID